MYSKRECPIQYWVLCLDFLCLVIFAFYLALFCFSFASIIFAFITVEKKNYYYYYYLYNLTVAFLSLKKNF